MSHPSRAPEAVARRHLDVERLTRAGKSIPDICRETGLSQTSVVRIRRQRGLSKPKRRPLTPAEIGQAQALLDDGAPVAEVVRTLGCGRSQIDDLFPGRAWTNGQCLEHLRTLRSDTGNHSSDQIDGMWRAKKAAAAAFELLGAKVTIHRSLPVEWPDHKPTEGEKP